MTGSSNIVFFIISLFYKYARKCQDKFWLPSSSEIKWHSLADILQLSSEIAQLPCSAISILYAEP